MFTALQTEGTPLLNDATVLEELIQCLLQIEMNCGSAGFASEVLPFV